MQKVPASMAHFAIESGQVFLGTLAPVTAFFAPMELLMCDLDLLFGVLIVPWIRNLRAIGEHRKGFHTQVNADGFFGGME
jgi:hypothetical protein